MDDINFGLSSVAPGAVSLTARGERGIFDAALRVCVVALSMMTEAGREPFGVVMTVDLSTSNTIVDAGRASVVELTAACLTTGAGGGTCSGVTSWWTVSVCFKFDGCFGAVEADVSVAERLSWNAYHNEIRPIYPQTCNCDPPLLTWPARTWGRCCCEPKSGQRLARPGWGACPDSQST